MSELDDALKDLKKTNQATEEAIATATEMLTAKYKLACKARQAIQKKLNETTKIAEDGHQALMTMTLKCRASDDMCRSMSMMLEDVRAELRQKPEPPKKGGHLFIKLFGLLVLIITGSMIISRSEHYKNKATVQKAQHTKLQTKHRLLEGEFWTLNAATKSCMKTYHRYRDRWINSKSSFKFCMGKLDKCYNKRYNLQRKAKKKQKKPKIKCDPKNDPLGCLSQI